MDKDDRERGQPVRLPVAVAKDANVALDLEQALLGRWKHKAARQEGSRQRLPVRPTQTATRNERLRRPRR